MENRFVCPIHRLISHRANLNGPDKNRENKLEYICECLEIGLDVEIDVHFINNQYYLGHDYKQEIIHLDFMNKWQNNLWIHAKNLEALFQLAKTNLNFFWHEKDKYTLTSKNYIWTYPRQKTTEMSIIVCQNYAETQQYIHKCLYKICTDFILLP